LATSASEVALEGAVGGEITAQRRAPSEADFFSRLVGCRGVLGSKGVLWCGGGAGEVGDGAELEHAALNENGGAVTEALRNTWRAGAGVLGARGWRPWRRGACRKCRDWKPSVSGGFCGAIDGASEKAIGLPLEAAALVRKVCADAAIPLPGLVGSQPRHFRGFGYENEAEFSLARTFGQKADEPRH
jgi:hypothetical protein